MYIDISVKKLAIYVISSELSTVKMLRLIIAVFSFILSLNQASIILEKTCPTINPVKGLHEYEMTRTQWILNSHYPLTSEDGKMVPSQCTVFYWKNYQYPTSDRSMNIFEYFLDSLSVENETIIVKRRRSILRYTNPSNMSMRIQFFYDDEEEAPRFCNTKEKHSLDKIFWKYEVEIDFYIVLLNNEHMVAFNCLPLNATHSKQSFLAFSTVGSSKLHKNKMQDLNIDWQLVAQNSSNYVTCCPSLINQCSAKRESAVFCRNFN